MFLAILIVHVLVSIFLVLIVLIQTGRGAELGAAFGGMGQATYGRTQGTFLTKLTTGLAVVFMSTSLSLAFISSEQPTRSIITTPQAPVEQSAPGTPPAGQAAPQAEAPAQPPAGQQPAAAQGEPAPAEKPLEQTKAPPQSGTPKAK